MDITRPKKGERGNEKLSADEKALLQLYEGRYRALRTAQKYSIKRNPYALQYYHRYLSILSAYFDVEKDDLDPELFDSNKGKDLAELLLISYVYLNLAKLYDRSPHLISKLNHSLQQFVKFTVDFPYQYANAKILNILIKKKRIFHAEAFKEACRQIQHKSHSCFVASDLYGQKSMEVQKLRRVKQQLQKFPMGISLCSFYYQTLCPLYFSFDTKKGNPLKTPVKYLFDFFLKMIPS